MKRIVSAVLVCLLLVGSAFALASCGGISGTYENAATSTTVEFSGDTVNISWSTEFLGAKVSKDTSAKYEIKENDDGDKVIVFTYEEGADQHLTLIGDTEFDFSEGTVDGAKFIKIGALTYTEKK